MARPHKADRLTDMADLVCDERVVHVEAVRAARMMLPSGRVLADLAGLFSALGDPTRLRIMSALTAQELCVCDLAVVIGTSESAVSHQLRGLRTLGLVRTRREGRRVYYALDDAHVTTLYHQALDHIEHRTEEGT
jgi:ArsR family transcriptional regulator